MFCSFEGNGWYGLNNPNVMFSKTYTHYYLGGAQTLRPRHAEHRCECVAYLSCTTVLALTAAGISSFSDAPSLVQRFTEVNRCLASLAFNSTGKMVCGYDGLCNSRSKKFRTRAVGVWGRQGCCMKSHGSRAQRFRALVLVDI